MPCAVLHPDDALARGLTDGQIVRLSNDRGEVSLRLHVRDEVQPGVVLVPGQRPDEEAAAGTVNMLCADSFTDIGRGRDLSEHLAGCPCGVTAPPVRVQLPTDCTEVNGTVRPPI